MAKLIQPQTNTRPVINKSKLQLPLRQTRNMTKAQSKYFVAGLPKCHMSYQFLLHR